MKFEENKCIKESEDYTDEAFEKLCCSEAGMCTLKAVDEKGTVLLAFHLKLSPTTALSPEAPCCH